MKKLILVALLLLAAGDAVAVGPPFQTSTAGTAVACASPCTVTSTAINILTANPNRSGCFLQAIGNATLFCKKATIIVSAATTSNYDFVLQSTAATTPGNAYQCDSAFSIWTGAVNCIASASQSSPDLGVAESQ